MWLNLLDLVGVVSGLCISCIDLKLFWEKVKAMLIKDYT